MKKILSLPAKILIMMRRTFLDHMHLALFVFVVDDVVADIGVVVAAAATAAAAVANVCCT